MKRLFLVLCILLMANGMYAAEDRIIMIMGGGSAIGSLGTIATQDSDNVSITGGSITGVSISDLVLFNKTLSSDHTYSGETVQEAVGESVAFPDALYFDVSEGEWKKADMNQIGTMPCEGLALETKGDGQTCLILVKGYVRDDSWNWAVDDSVHIVYVSTAGALSTTAVSGAGDHSQAVGTIRSADIIYFNPSIAMAVHS